MKCENCGYDGNPDGSHKCIICGADLDVEPRDADNTDSQEGEGKPIPTRVIAACILGLFIVIGAIWWSRSHSTVQPSGSATAAGRSEWPEHEVEVVVPYTEGSVIDTYCRALFDRIEQKTKGRFVITNQPGDNGMLGALYVMGKEPDGYCILFNNTAASLVQEASGKFNYSFTDDFDNCATVALDRSYVLCAAPSSDYEDLSGMIEYAKEHPGELRYCNVAGSMTDYVGRHLEDLAGIEFENVDVGSAANEQIAALLNNQIDLAVSYYTSVADRIDAGELICLGVMANERIDGIDAPTFKEQGYDIVSERKYEVKFPKGTDPAIIEYLSGFCKEVTEDPWFAEVLKKQYVEPYYRDAASMNAEDTEEVQELKKYLQ